METFRLTCHPDRPSQSVRGLKARIERRGRLVWLRFDLSCRLVDLRLPAPALPARQDGLWQHTCFEVFIGAGAYCEFNFAPSGQWAAYDFSAYREGMAQRPIALEPQIALDVVRGRFTQEVLFDPGKASEPLALSAVIEEMDGTKSYWALAHPPGKPDFHHPTCFAATLPPPSEP